MFDIGPSQFDVRLVAFRIPIRVHWSFWLVSILLGWNPERADLVFIWVVCSFFAILVHELGHALTAEWFGWPSQIVLYFGGGLAMSDRHRNYSHWRSIAVSAMGPGAGFLFLAVVVGIHIAINLNHIRVHEYVAYTIRYLEIMNLFYGLFNLLPVLPLDGGQICSSLCQQLRLRDPAGVTMKIGIVASGGAAYLFFAVLNQQFAGMMMLMLCLQNVGMLQSRR
jgi:stage IV sporulation protein FB